MGRKYTDIPEEGSHSAGRNRDHYQVKHLEEESKVMAAAASGIAKGVLYVCFTIAFCFLMSTCTVDAETIVQCEDSCGESGIKEVTSTSCECQDTVPLSASPWVIPGN